MMVEIPEEVVKAAAAAIRRSGDTYTEMAQAALTAALPFLPVQGAVKKLEWFPLDLSNTLYAHSAFGMYTVWEIDGVGFFRKEGGYGGTKVDGSIEAAKAAAQADYEARILSAIEAAPPLSKLKAENARLKAQLAEARKALDGLLKPFEGDDCRYDHHGYCQAHFLQEVDECCVKIARRALAGGQEDG